MHRAAAQRRAPQLFLPFEDERLSVILSKAFLLAADDAARDVSIRHQLRGSRG